MCRSDEVYSLGKLGYAPAGGLCEALGDYARGPGKGRGHSNRLNDVTLLKLASWGFITCPLGCRLMLRQSFLIAFREVIDRVEVFDPIQLTKIAASSSTWSFRS